MAEIMYYIGQGAKKAAKDTDSAMRLCRLAVHYCSAFFVMVGRTDKPFNPMLGETYEMVMPDFRLLIETVSHHPPVVCFHFTGDGFDFLVNS